MNDPMRIKSKNLSADEVLTMNRVKRLGETLWAALDELPSGRETALAKTKVEEAVMWAVKAITG